MHHELVSFAIRESLEAIVWHTEVSESVLTVLSSVTLSSKAPSAARYLKLSRVCGKVSAEANRSGENDESRRRTAHAHWKRGRAETVTYLQRRGKKQSLRGNREFIPLGDVNHAEKKCLQNT